MLTFAPATVVAAFATFAPASVVAVFAFE